MINFYRKYILIIHILLMLILPICLNIGGTSNDFYTYLICLVFFTIPAIATLTEILLTLNVFFNFQFEIKNLSMAIFDGIMISIATALFLILFYFVGGPGFFLSNPSIYDNKLLYNFFYNRKEIIIVLFIMIIFLISVIYLNIKTNISHNAKNIFKSLLIFTTLLIILYTYLYYIVNHSEFNDTTELLIYIFAILVPFNMVLISLRLIKNK